MYTKNEKRALISLFIFGIFAIIFGIGYMIFIVIYFVFTVDWHYLLLLIPVIPIILLVWLVYDEMKNDFINLIKS